MSCTRVRKRVAARRLWREQGCGRHGGCTNRVSALGLTPTTAPFFCSSAVAAGVALVSLPPRRDILYDRREAAPACPEALRAVTRIEAHEQRASSARALQLLLRDFGVQCEGPAARSRRDRDKHRPARVGDDSAAPAVHRAVSCVAPHRRGRARDSDRSEMMPSVECGMPQVCSCEPAEKYYAPKHRARGTGSRLIAAGLR